MESALSSEYVQFVDNYQKRIQVSEYLEKVKKAVRALEDNESELPYASQVLGLYKNVQAFQSQLKSLDLLLDSTIVLLRQLGQVPDSILSKAFSFDQNQLKDNVDEVSSLVQEIKAKLQQLGRIQSSLKNMDLDFYDAPKELQMSLDLVERGLFDFQQDMGVVHNTYKQLVARMDCLAKQFGSINKDDMQIEHHFILHFLKEWYHNLKKEKKEALNFREGFNWWEDNSCLFALLKQIFDWTQEQEQVLKKFQRLGYTTVQMLNINQKVEELTQEVEETMLINFKRDLIINGLSEAEEKEKREKHLELEQQKQSYYENQTVLIVSQMRKDLRRRMHSVLEYMVGSQLFQLLTQVEKTVAIPFHTFIQGHIVDSQVMHRLKQINETHKYLSQV